MFAIRSASTGLFYSGVTHDNGTYGSGYELHTFAYKSIQAFGEREEAIKKLDEINKDPDYLRLINVGMHSDHRKDFRDLAVVEFNVTI